MKTLDKTERKGRLLSYNKRSEQPRHHVFFDVESKVDKISDKESRHTFWLGWACYWRRNTSKEEWCFIDQPEKLLDFIESHCHTKDRVYVWAHNAFYDFAITKMHVLLAERGWKQESHYFAGGKGAWFLVVKQGARSLVFIDTMNFYQQSLAALGHLIGEEKQDVNPLTASEEILIEYCKQDVNIIRKAVERFLTFIAANDLGNVGKTLASTAMNVYRHKFMTRRIEIHKHEPSWQLEHGSYYGGRVELFRVGRVEGPLYYLDINSQYPSVMATHELPFELLAYEEGELSIVALENLVDNYYIIADVTLVTNSERYPVRLLKKECQDGMLIASDPLRCLTQHGLRVVYPIGSFRTIIGGQCLRAALHDGAIKRVARVAVYRKGILFADFVKEFWTRRREAQVAGNTVDAYLYKILLNSFYGKWGQKQSHILYTAECQKDAWEVEEVIVNGKQVLVERIMGKERWIARGEKASYNAFPAISAAVTEGGREMLWMLWEEAGFANCIYSDTDSLIVNEQGFQALQHRIGNDLGQLKLEHTLQYLIVHGPKDYQHDKGEKHKGISGKAVFNAEQRTWTQEQWLRPHGSLRQKQLDIYTTVSVEKRMQRTITTKTALAGGLLAPFRLGE